jgi:prolyl-tRNA synthetase
MTALLSRAEEHTRSHLCSVSSMEALTEALDAEKVAVVHWCRHRGCGDAIEEKTTASILGTDVRSVHIPVTDGPCIVCGKPGRATLIGRAY